jgi:hypothetical protein
MVIGQPVGHVRYREGIRSEISRRAWHLRLSRNKEQSAKNQDGYVTS